MARLSELGVNFDHWCFACGRQNPSGLHLDFAVSVNRAEARYTGDRRHQGYDGTLHGGVVAALLDETMGWAIFHQGIWGVTGRIAVTFRQPVPVGEELLVTGEVVRERARAIETRGEVRRTKDDTVLAEAEALFLRMPEERRAELEQRYARSGDAFARVRAAVAAEAGMQRRHGARASPGYAGARELEAEGREPVGERRRQSMRASHGDAGARELKAEGREPVGERRRQSARTSPGYAGARELKAEGREPVGERRPGGEDQ